jgi:hypothetical protein
MRWGIELADSLRWFLTAPLVAASLALLAGCGAGGDGTSRALSAKVSHCRILKQDEYGASIVEHYYAAGKLGSRARVAAELERDSTVKDWGETFFDKLGHLIPYSKLEPAQVVAFNGWMFGARVEGIADVDSKIDKQLARINAECGSG